MVKEVYDVEKANQIMDRLAETVVNKGSDLFTAMTKAGVEFGMKVASGNLDIVKMIEDSVLVRNDRDELLMCMPIANITEVYKQYS